MPKGLFGGKRLESRKSVSDHRRNSMHTGKRGRESNEYVQVLIVATVAMISLAVLVTPFAVSMLNDCHATVLLSAIE